MVDTHQHCTCFRFNQQSKFIIRLKNTYDKMYRLEAPYHAEEEEIENDVYSPYVSVTTVKT